MPRLLYANVFLAFAFVTGCSSTEVANPQQKEFLQIIEQGSTQYDDAPNEIKKDEVEAARDQKFCDAQFASPQGWTGEIRDLSTGFGGLELEIRIGDDIDVLSGNIPEDDPVFAMAADLQEGDTVTFDGDFDLAENCVRAQSLLQASRMDSPDFKITLKSVTKA